MFTIVSDISEHVHKRFYLKSIRGDLLAETSFL